MTDKELITSAELAKLTGLANNTCTARLRRAGLTSTLIKGHNHWPRQLALANIGGTQNTMPPGTTTLSELAQMAEKCTSCIDYRLKKAGIKPIGFFRRCAPGSAGGHPVPLYPRTEAIYAALK